MAKKKSQGVLHRLVCGALLIALGAAPSLVLATNAKKVLVKGSATHADSSNPIFAGLSKLALGTLGQRMADHLDRDEQLISTRVSPSIVTLSREGFDLVEIFRLWDTPNGPDAGVVTLDYGADKAIMSYRFKQGRTTEHDVVHVAYSASELQKGYLLKDGESHYFFADQSNPLLQSFRFNDFPKKIENAWLVDLQHGMQSIIPFDQIPKYPAVVFKGGIRDLGDLVMLPSDFGAYLARKNALHEQSPYFQGEPKSYGKNLRIDLPDGKSQLVLRSDLTRQSVQFTDMEELHDRFRLFLQKGRAGQAGAAVKEVSKDDPSKVISKPLADTPSP